MFYHSLIHNYLCLVNTNSKSPKVKKKKSISPGWQIHVPKGKKIHMDGGGRKPVFFLKMFCGKCSLQTNVSPHMGSRFAAKMLPSRQWEQQSVIWVAGNCHPLMLTTWPSSNTQEYSRKRRAAITPCRTNPNTHTSGLWDSLEKLLYPLRGKRSICSKITSLNNGKLELSAKMKPQVFLC